MDRTRTATFLSVVRQVQEAYGDLCFACGRSNPHGLHLAPLGFDEEWVSAMFEPTATHVGAPPAIHGGIAATIADEIMVWAGIAFERVMTVTGTLDLRYRRPLTIDSPVVAKAKVVERSGRRLRMHSTLETQGRTAVEGRGLYLVSNELADMLGGPDS